MKRILILKPVLYILLFFSTGCGFPGPVFTYNRSTEENTTDTTKTSIKEMDYFCFDYDGNFRGQKIKTKIIDLRTDKILRIDILRSTELRMKDGRKKKITRTYIFDGNGKLNKKIRSNYQTYGRYGRLRKYHEVEYLENGQKIKTIKRSTKRNPDRFQKKKVIGNDF